MTSSGEYISEDLGEEGGDCNCPDWSPGGVVTVGEIVGVVVVGTGVSVFVGAVVAETWVDVTTVCVV
jgi:hypothetical protein